MLDELKKYFKEKKVSNLWCSFLVKMVNSYRGNTGQSWGWSPSFGFASFGPQTPNLRDAYMIQINQRAKTK